MSTPKTSCLIAGLACTLWLAGCNGSNQVYYAQTNDTWTEISKSQFDSLRSGQPMASTTAVMRPALSPSQEATLDPDGTLRGAIARNPMAMRTNRTLDFNPDGSAPDAEAVADVSLEIALDLCNIPPGTRLTSDTPCNIRP